MQLRKYVVSSHGRSVICDAETRLDAAVTSLNRKGLPPSKFITVAEPHATSGLVCSAEHGTVSAVRVVAL